MKKMALQLSVAMAAIALALVVGGLIILAHGQDPVETYDTLIGETLGAPMVLGQVLFKTTTLIFTGIAAAFAFRAGMFNIGGEGQLYLGAFLCAIVGTSLPAGTPVALALPILMIAAFAGGALGAAPPAILKATRGTHEVINTIMMNFVLQGVVNWMLVKTRSGADTVHTRPILSGGRLAPLSSLFESMHGSDANLSLLVGLLCCSAVFYIFKRTRLGYELRAVGFSPHAAEYGGVSPGRAVMTSLLLSGGLAGLGGVNFVMGSQGYFEEDFAPYQGYMGVAVALLARNHPLGIIPAAFLFALLSQGGQTVQQFVPKEIGDILQAVVIVFIVAGMKIAESIQTMLEKRKVPDAG